MVTSMKKASTAIALALATLGAGQTQAAPVFFSGNGHYYEYFQTAVTNSQAFSLAASASPIVGFQSYLVTITSAAENTFIGTSVTGGSGFWLGASDGATEGVWQWIVGPESGQIFFGPGAPVGSFSNFSIGEPNNFGGEHFLASLGGGANPEWHDYGLPFAEQRVSYVVEYSAIPLTNGVPEPTTWATMLLGFGMMGFAMRRKSHTIRWRFS